MRKSAFYLDALDNWEEPGFVGYTHGDSWNGWGTPAFEIEEAQRLLDALKKAGITTGYYDAVTDSFMLYAGGGAPEVYQGYSITTETGQLKVYAIGAYAWCWEEAEPLVLTPPLLAWLKYALKRHETGYSDDQRLCSPLYVWEVLKYQGWFKHVNGWLRFNDYGYAQAKALVESVKVSQPMLNLISGNKKCDLRIKATEGPWADYLIENGTTWEALVRDPVMAKLFVHSLDLARFLYQLYQTGDIPVNQLHPETWLKLEAIMVQLLELPTDTKS